MRAFAAATLAALLTAAFAFAEHSHAAGRHGMNGMGWMGHHDRPKTLLAFNTMYGVDGPFVGETNPIRGVPGDELPWEIARSVHGRLESDGHLQLNVRGLVFTNDDVVPPELRGKNDETEFRALVSCLSEDGDAVVERNVTSGGFKANEQGDSRIDAHLTLPDPCVAPIVMVLAGSEDKWFAVNGFESEEDN